MVWRIFYQTYKIESNRQKHFWYAIPCGFLLTILFVAGLAAGMEFKDKSYGDKWDWLDFLATILGGLVGQIIALLLMWKGGVI